MQTLRRPKVRDQACEQIKQYIIERKLVSGDRLPTETQLAEALGISRLSLREATKALEFLGIVESKTGVGLTVGRIDMERVTEHLGFHTGLLDVDPQQLIDSRVILETGVLSHVVRRMKDDPTIEARFREIVRQFASATRPEDFLSRSTFSFIVPCWKPAGCNRSWPSATCCMSSFSDFAKASSRRGGNRESRVTVGLSIFWRMES